MPETAERRRQGLPQERRLRRALPCKIRDLCAKRRQLIDMRKALACQSQQNRHPAVRAMDAEMMTLLQAQIARAEAAIAEGIAAGTPVGAARTPTPATAATGRAPCCSR